VGTCPGTLALPDPLLGARAQHLDFIFPDRTATVVKRRLPSELAAVGGDVGDLQWTLRPGRGTEHAQLHPLLVEAVAVLGADLVLAGVASQGVGALKQRVVVGVGDLDPLVGLSDEHGLLLGDVAVVLGPGLVGDGLTDDVDGPGHGLANLDGDNLKAVLDIVADQPWLHCSLCLHFLHRLLNRFSTSLHDNLVHHQLGLGLILADTLAGDGARVGEAGVEAYT
jgi:hypothetical protein